MVSYKLPGYHAPEKFYSPSDVPFYVPCQLFSKWCIMMGLNLRTLNCVSPICKGYLQRDVVKKKKPINSPDTAPS
eukprot:Em0001g1205a